MDPHNQPKCKRQYISSLLRSSSSSAQAGVAQCGILDILCTLLHPLHTSLLQRYSCTITSNS
jgi:hypothetical protein